MPCVTNGIIHQMQMNKMATPGRMASLCQFCRRRLNCRMSRMSLPSRTYLQNSRASNTSVEIRNAYTSFNRDGQTKVFVDKKAAATNACFSGPGNGEHLAGLILRRRSFLLPPILMKHHTSAANASTAVVGHIHLSELNKQINWFVSVPVGNIQTRHLSLSVRSQFHGTGDKPNSDAAVVSDAELEENYVAELSEALLAGERWALARAITLVEAKHKKGKRQAQVLLRNVLDHLREVQLQNSGVPPSFRIGLTGPPGAGKSTFIEAMGKRLTAAGHRVAVLAVDPSSSITGGSLLGDKTRMTELSRDPNAYIRASPSSGTLGGVTRNTNDTILLCEAAGYDVIIVETIGVGQSEYVVADTVDMLVLLIPPAGGDELQGLKKGIVERADFILINKADGELLIPARRMRSEYTSAVKLMYKRSPLWNPKVKQVSAKTGDGLGKAWEVMEEYRGIMVDAGEFSRKRQLQRRVWMWQHIKDRLMEEFRESRGLGVEVQHWQEEVMAGRCTPGMAADELLKSFSKISRDS